MAKSAQQRQQVIDNFAATVRGARERSGLSLEELADAVDSNVDTIFAVEMGHRPPPHPAGFKWRAFAKAVGIPDPAGFEAQVARAHREATS